MSDRELMLNKVPEVTLIFWIIKIMATTVGETAADLLNFKLHLGLTTTSVIMGVAFVLVLALQMRVRQYIPWVYWTTVVFISVFGTLVTDNLVDNYGVALETTTVVFSIALALTFIVWYASERTLSIHSIHTSRREGFYWLAILFTFALGTAAGDWVAETMRLGYALSAVIFASVIALVALAHYRLKLNAVTAFWIAYILTRPFGASCGDWLSHSVAKGGLGFGILGTSAVFLVIIVVMVGYLSLDRSEGRDKQQG